MQRLAKPVVFVFATAGTPSPPFNPRLGLARCARHATRERAWSFSDDEYMLQVERLFSAPMTAFGDAGIVLYLRCSIYA
jgi:hypothetical protein